jgi:voltage-gated potassium channel Kch
MIRNIAMAAVLMVLTTAVHAVCTAVVVDFVRGSRAERWGRGSRIGETSQLAALILMFFVAALIEVSIWATAYLALGAVTGGERALYFSMVTFTTLGYGDVVVEGTWRLLASFQAANGIILFGWTTALLVAVIRAMHVAHDPARRKSRS